MDSLYVELDARLRRETDALVRRAAPTGGRLARARGLVAQRAELFELVSSYKRSTELLRWRSPFLASAHRRMVRKQRSDLHRWLPELESAPDDLAQAVEQATSYEAWERLRSDQHLGVERARAAVERCVLALLRELPR